MNPEEKLLWMFEQVHGKITGRCYVELVYDDEENATAVNVMKYGNLCWGTTKADLVFDYLTRHLDA